MSTFLFLFLFLPLPIAGDLLDEGSIATEAEFSSYVQRFLTIFPPESTRGSLYTPGDNDVGGEGVDRVTLSKLDRFQNQFGANKHVVPVCPFLGEQTSFTLLN